MQDLYEQYMSETTRDARLMVSWKTLLWSIDKKEDENDDAFLANIKSLLQDILYQWHQSIWEGSSALWCQVQKDQNFSCIFDYNVGELLTREIIVILAY